MRSDSLSDRRTYWPRAGPAESFVPDLGDDRPCSNCGYNLRGLSFNSACPECGATWGVLRESEPVPWNDDGPSVRSYFQTIMMVLTSPRDLSAQIWTRDVLWRQSAQRFRRINVLLGATSVTAIVFAMTALGIGLERAFWCAPLDVAAVLWWFIVLTGDPARFFADKGTPTACRRAEVLSAYLSGVLVLSPLHLVLLAIPLDFAGIDPVKVELALHGCLIGVQMLLMASAGGAMLWQLVELPRAGSFAVALGSMMVSALKGAVYVVVIPFIFAGIATSIGAG